MSLPRREVDEWGRRIGHKRIDEGDVFHICGHEISFTFRW
jgi:hypothetical protein